MKTVIIYEPGDIQTIKILLHDSIINLKSQQNNFTLIQTLDKLNDAYYLLCQETVE